MVRLGQAEAANDGTGCQPRQKGCFLCLAAKGVQGIHDQAGLDRECGAVAGVHALDFSRDQAIVQVAAAGAAMAIEAHTEQALCTQLAQDLTVKSFRAEGVAHTWHEARLCIVARRITHLALIGR